MKKKKCFRFLSALFAVMILATSAGFNVDAATSNGTKKTTTLLGYTYTYYSSIIKNSSSIFPCVDVSCTKKWPSGYVGMNIRLYNTSGTLVKSSGWIYDEGGAYSWSQPSAGTTKKGTYYSKGQVKLYNGNGYTTYTCNSSPNMTYSSIGNLEYEENVNGLTFGSDYYAQTSAECPDLVRVIGVNGNEGYVYNYELESNVNTPAQAIEYAESCPLVKTINVYAENGQTVIDTFELSYEKGTLIR